MVFRRSSESCPKRDWHFVCDHFYMARPSARAPSAIFGAVVAVAAVGCSRKTPSESAVRERVASAAVVALDASAARSREVTYSQDVRPILEAHCQRCHVRGGIAPFALTSPRSVTRRRPSPRRLEHAECPPGGRARRTSARLVSAGVTTSAYRTTRSPQSMLGSVEAQKRGMLRRRRRSPSPERASRRRSRSPREMASCSRLVRATTSCAASCSTRSSIALVT